MPIDKRTDVRSPLGDARAEKDRLLDSAFLQTAEYWALLGQNAGYVVVGRRGTGKSALFRELKSALAEQKNQQVVTLEPDGHETLPLYGLIEALSDARADYHTMHEISTYLFRYLLLMEIACRLRTDSPKCFHCLEEKDRNLLGRHLNGWESTGDTPLARLFARVYSIIEENIHPAILLGKLNLLLQYKQLVEPARQMLHESRRTYAYLIDRLDEGFRPEDIGVAFINGVVSATTELSGAIHQVRPTVFLRDNILRAIQQKDRNYTRNVEGRILRIHWGEDRLLELITKRIRIAFEASQASGESGSIAIWNRYIEPNFHGMQGFRKVLELTLYRPRDLITLLNVAFFEASARGDAFITNRDIETSADEVSKLRLEDLIKEYSNIIPGLEELLRAFASGSPFFTSHEARTQVEEIAKTTRNPALTQTIRLYGRPEILNELHSIGFIGYRSEGQRFTFCHDGKLTGPTFASDLDLMVHPCYWRALDLTYSGLRPEAAAQIHDDYNERYEAINITSIALERRQQFIANLVSTFDELPADNEPAFFHWIRRALSVLLAGGIRDLEESDNLLHGRITSTRGLWGDIQDRYGMNHLLFLLRNEESLTLDAISEAVSRAKKARQSPVIFVVSRGKEAFVRAGKELDAIRNHHEHNGITVVYTTAHAICRSLIKLKNPETDQEPTRFVSLAIDQTIHSYIRHEKVDRKRRRSKALQCDLLLVVATEVERNAVLDMLTSEYNCEISKVFAPRRTYFKISGIANTRLMLVQCEMGSSGIGASQATVRDAIDDVNPTSVVMVGIAFGFKPSKQKIGDVLVSKQLQAYELRRVNADGEKVSCSLRGDRVTASARLLSRLRAAQYGWPGVVRFGLLLSGEKLIDNKTYRDLLSSEEPEAIGGEMEGSGVYVASADFGKWWIIVKGICDWADGDKGINKTENQSKAAANAAAFVVHAICTSGLGK